MPDIEFDQAVVGRAIAIVLGSTLVLTANFVGVVALFRGQTAGLGNRVPFYVLAMAVVFVVAVFLLDDRRNEGLQVILPVVGISVASLVLIVFGAEGVVYANRYPDQVVGSNLGVYFVAAGLICTGLAVWGLRHWREFAGHGSRM